MNLRDAVKEALEALEYGQHSLKQVSEHEWVSRCQLAMQALRAALAEPVQEQEQGQVEPVKPYCYIYEYDQGFGLHREFHPVPYNGMKPSRTVPVYAAPFRRKPLTDEEIVAINDKHYNIAYRDFDADIAIARAIESAHGIGEE